MPTVFICLLLIVALTTVVSLSVLHQQFRKSVPYLWKQRVLSRTAALRGRQFELTSSDPGGVRAKTDRIAADLFDRYLRTVPVDLLAEFPGIGPGTVERVRGAGGRSLADLVRFPFQSVPGIGPAKARDLETAVAKLVRDARSRFDAGGCPEGVEFRRKVAALQAKEQAQVVARQRELAAVDAGIDEINSLIADAHKVTFWNYLFRGATTGPGDEVMNRPLPTGEPPAAAIPEAKLVPRPNPPAPPVAAGRPVAARSAPPPAVFPPTAESAAKPAVADVFAAELATANAAPASAADTHPDLPRLWAYARFGFVVARADGRVAQAETKVIRSFLDETFGHDPVLVRHIDPLLERTAARIPPEVGDTGRRGESHAPAQRSGTVSLRRADRRCLRRAEPAGAGNVDPGGREVRVGGTGRVAQAAAGASRPRDDTRAAGGAGDRAGNGGHRRPRPPTVHPIE